MNKQKGFTIIELIVVIAIIAVLAAIVMVNVTSYIGKSRDAAIKADLENAFIVAQSYYAENNAYDTAMCASSTGSFYQGYNAAVGQRKANGTYDCDVSATAWRAAVQLNNPTAATGWYCIDSTGAKKEVSSDPSGTTTACP